MSHFTLMVHLSAAALLKHDGSVDAALKEAMIPFEESPPEGSPHVEFEDAEPEYLEKWESGKTEQIRLADGTLLFPFDDRFKVKRDSFFDKQEYIYPEGSAKVEVSYKEIYASFEVFMKEYAGYTKRDPKTGKFGSYRNPNAKWDWFQIGGRWRGHFPVKPGAQSVVGPSGAFDNPAKEGGSDVVHFEELDLDRCARIEREKLADFIADYRAMIAGKKFPVFEGPRETMMDLGLMRVEQGPEPKPNEKVLSWATEHNLRPDDERRAWSDVILDLSDEALSVCASYFSPLRTYAALDASGAWDAAGEMGWFGCGSDTPEKNLGYAATFFDKHVRPAANNGVLVCVDCHI